jgi:hypothetical protein
MAQRIPVLNDSHIKRDSKKLCGIASHILFSFLFYLNEHEVFVIPAFAGMTPLTGRL